METAIATRQTGIATRRGTGTTTTVATKTGITTKITIMTGARKV
jgi:hypothetical protein